MKKILVSLLAIAMVLSMVACSNGNENKGTKEAVTITFHYINGVGEQQYTDVVEAKLNEIMQAIEGYEHISIDLKPYSLDNYQSAITLAQSNKEQLDIINTFELSNYTEMVANGDFIELDSLLAKYPGVTSDIPDWLINYGKIDGKVYYVPTYQQAQSPSFFYAPVEYFEYYYEVSGKDEAYIRQCLNSGDPMTILEFCEDFYLAVVEKTGLTSKKMFGGWKPYHFYNKDEITVDGGIGAMLIEGDDEPVYWPMTDEFHDVYEKLNTWYKKGWINEPTKKNSYDFKTDDNSMVFGIGTNAQSEEAYGKAVSNDNRGTCKAIRVTDHCYIEGTWAAGGNAIYADCEHPEEAMMVLELLMSEKCVEFYNTLIWGLEGIHYKWVDKETNRIETLEFVGTQGGAETTYCAWNWNTGNIFNGWLNQSSPDDNHYKFIEEEIHNAETTVISPFIGDTWHFEDVSNERGQCAAVNKEFFGTLYAVADFEGTLAEYRAKLKAAGVDKIMETITKQYEEFIKN